MHIRAKLLSFIVAGIMFMPLLRLSAGINGDIYVAGVSKYLWRGQILYSGFAVQPGADLNYNNFSIGFWGSFCTKEAKFGEADFLAGYSTSISIFNLGAGYTFYTFPNAASTSHEAYINAEVNIFLSPSLILYYDFADGDGAYMEGGLSIPFTVGLEFTFAPTLGLNLGQWGYKSSFSVLGLGLSTTIAFGDNIDITPLLFYQIALNKQYNSDGFASLTVQYNF